MFVLVVLSDLVETLALVELLYLIELLSLVGSLDLVEMPVLVGPLDLVEPPGLVGPLHWLGPLVQLVLLLFAGRCIAEGPSVTGYCCQRATAAVSSPGKIQR
jgi:hypothetical protein